MRGNREAQRVTFAGQPLERPADTLLEDPEWVRGAMETGQFMVFGEQQRLCVWAENGAPWWATLAELRDGYGRAGHCRRVLEVSERGGRGTRLEERGRAGGTG